jgi:antirestriction protein ArdC
MATDKTDKILGVVSKALEVFKEGKFTDMVERTYIEYKAGIKPKRSIANDILVLIQGGTDCRGFNQWSNVGRQVQKGEKANFMIWGPIMQYRTIKTTNENGEEETTKKKVCVGFNPIWVFDIAQTKVADESKWQEVEKAYKPIELPVLHDVTQQLGIEVEYAPMQGGYWGKTNGKDKIQLCTHDVKTFFHELIHCVDGKLHGELKGGQHADQEIVADMGALVLCQMYGHEGWESHVYNYVRGYANDHDGEKTLQMVMSLTNRIVACVDYVVSIHEQQQTAVA